MTRPMPGPPEYWWYCTPPHGEPGLWTSDMDPAEYMPFTHLQHKRLTDAECAAEYWRAEAEILYFDPEVDHLAWSQAVSRQEIINRFATRSHALEES